MFSICVRQCSKVYVSSFKFELTTKKRIQNLLSLIDQELGSVDQESQKKNFCRILNQA